MLKKERHHIILQEIAHHQKVISAQLSVQLQTSEDTIRRDLNELASAGHLLKVHGGALAIPVINNNTEQEAMALMQQGLQLLLSSNASQTVRVMIFSISPSAGN